MRRVIGLLLFLAVVLGTPGGTNSAQSVLTFNPPLTKIDLRRFEPGSTAKVRDLAVEATDKNTGILSQDYDHPRSPRGPYWDAGPFALVFPQSNDTTWKLTVNPAGFSLLRACGYTSPEEPTATLTYPDGHEETLSGTQPEEFEGCWDYDVEASFGMQFGLYRIELNHREGRLTRLWGVDYPYCRTAQGIKTPDGSLQLVLMGFAPAERITVGFYVGTGKDRRHIATRTNVQAGPHGSIAVNVAVAANAPFKLEDIQYYIPSISQYAIRAFTGGWQIHQDWDKAGFEGSCTGHYYLGDFNTLRSRGKTTLPLYAGFDDTSREIRQVPSNAEAQVLEERPALQNGRVVVWQQVRLSQGLTGWIVQSHQTAKAPAGQGSLGGTLFGDGKSCPGALPSRLVIGGQGYVLPDGPNRVRIEPAGAVIGRIPEGGNFTVLTGPRCTSNHIAWWKVDYDGLVGWTPEGQGLEYWLEPTE
jgi:hypothetical protein